MRNFLVLALILAAPGFASACDRCGPRVVARNDKLCTMTVRHGRFEYHLLDGVCVLRRTAAATEDVVVGTGKLVVGVARGTRGVLHTILFPDCRSCTKKKRTIRSSPPAKAGSSKVPRGKRQRTHRTNRLRSVMLFRAR